ncbi:DUF1648 domain-containing protein [Paenibacillus sp. TRM 82003]|nr:DUF1648 domain-containing protein [Paenibacillus sp. TRM 82003]
MTMKSWVLPIGAAAVAAIVSLLYYSELPEQMAIHFGSSNAPDRFAGKPVGAFLLPALILFVTAVTNFSAAAEKDAERRRRLAAGIGDVSGIVAILLLAVHLFTIAYNLGYPLSPSLFAALAVGATFVAMGNIAPRLPQKTVRLFRMTDAAYAVYARFVGRIMVAGGLVILLTVFLPSTFGFYAFLTVGIACLLAVIASSVYFDR